MTDETNSAGKASKAPSSLGSNPVWDAFFKDTVERFVEPEVLRRITSGDWPESQGITRFQVLLHEDRDLEVRLNDEVAGSAQIKPVEAVSEYAVGQAITLSDIAGVFDYRPREEDAGIPHVTGFGHVGGWTLAFEFAGGHPSRFDVLSRAGEFLQSAEDALGRMHLGSFLDTAYSATELLAKAELLSAKPTVELVLNSKKHDTTSTAYHLWANLGNTDRRFAALLKRLHKLRGPGRYLDAPVNLSPADAAEVLAVLNDMNAHVTSIVDAGFHVDDVPGYHVYATRNLQSGQLVGRDDFTLIPPRP